MYVLVMHENHHHYYQGSLNTLGLQYLPQVLLSCRVNVYFTFPTQSRNFQQLGARLLGKCVRGFTQLHGLTGETQRRLSKSWASL